VRVLHVIRSLRGGGGLETTVRRLVLATRDAGAEVEVLCLKTIGEIGESLRDADVPVHRIRPGLLGRRFIESLARHGGFDVAHGHRWDASAIVAGLGEKGLVPVTVGHFHSLGHLTKPGRAERVAAAEKHLSALVGCSPQVCDYMAGVTGVARERWRFIANPFDPEPYAALPPKTEARLVLEIDPGARVIGCVARLSPHKDHATLVRAAALVAKAEPGAVFVMAGKGDAAPFEALAAELGVQENVRFLGHRDDVPLVYAACDLAVLTSVREGLGLTLIEAFAAGLPVVASDVGGIPELVRPGETGLLCPPGRPERFADAIVELLGNDALRAEMAANALARSAAFTSERIARELLALYAECGAPNP